MNNKKIVTLVDLQAEKAKVKEACLNRESELNVKLHFLQNNLGAILLQTLLFKKKDGNEKPDTDKESGFVSSLIKGFTGVDINSDKGELLMSLAKTALPAIVFAMIKGFLKNKFSK